MIKSCKLCSEKIPTPKLGESWWCPNCQKYSFVCYENGVIESEVIRASNYYLVFLPIYKTASIVEVGNIKNMRGERVLRTCDMDELTHELAVYWSDKLKTYVLFQ